MTITYDEVQQWVLERIGKEGDRTDIEKAVLAAVFVCRCGSWMGGTCECEDKP